MIRRRGHFGLVFIMVALLAAACGRKTPPLPPETVRPAAITDLRYQLDEKGVSLIWTAPAETAGGRDLPALEGFEIHRAVVPEEEHCPGCPLPFGAPIKYSGDSPQPRETIRYHEPVLRPGHRYFYKVRTRYSWFLTSPDSNLVSFSWDILPAAPEKLSIESGDQELVLSWQPPRELVDSTPVAGPFQYQVYRSRDGEEFAPLGRPVDAPGLVDRAVRNGQIYYYRVRALRQVQETVIAGLASETAAGTPRDLTPPAPPRELTAIKTPQGVRLVWPAGAEPDLAGYRIYRRTGTAAAPIGEVKVPDTTFVDREPPASGRAFYTVTGFDAAEPSNESLPSPEGEVVF